MGIVNVTPDSFSDGGRHSSAQMAIEYAYTLMAAGADIVDIGGESTRPGAKVLGEAEEIDRVLPIIEALQGSPCIISVDTRKTNVMRAAIAAGIDMVNDVQALQAPDALQVVGESQVAVCLMHMRGEPGTMQQQLVYEDVVSEVCHFLALRVGAAVDAGVNPASILLDPGIGFGKSLLHNLGLIKHLPVLNELGFPVLVGASRKRMLGLLTGRSVEQREAATVAAHLYALSRGASVLRVHDVAACRDALTVWQALESVE